MTNSAHNIGHESPGGGQRPLDPQTTEQIDMVDLAANRDAPGQLRIGWWNIEPVSSVWFLEWFWDILDTYDIMFLTETHHAEVPLKDGWKVLGQDRGVWNCAGGTLACINKKGNAVVKEEWYPFDDFVWLLLDTQGT